VYTCTCLSFILPECTELAEWQIATKNTRGVGVEINSEGREMTMGRSPVIVGTIEREGLGERIMREAGVAIEKNMMMREIVAGIPLLFEAVIGVLRLTKE
jgi:hypothetical protein